MVLGLLLQEAPQSGYDLASRATRTISHFWPITKAQVYTELIRLEKAGYLEAEQVEQQEAPNKRLYRPTITGRDAFRMWAESADLGEPRLRHPLLLRLWFAPQAGRERLEQECRAFREHLLANQIRFTDLLSRNTSGRGRQARAPDGARYRALALRHGLLRIEAEIAWLDEVQEALGNRSD